MKEVEKVFKTYIANDGTEFATEQECLEYEMTLEKDAKAKELDVFALPHFDCTPLEVSRNDELWRWFFVRSEEELKAIQEVYYDEDCVAYDFEPREYPFWLVAAVFEDNLGYGFITTLGDIQSDNDSYFNLVKIRMEEAVKGSAPCGSVPSSQPAINVKVIIRDGVVETALADGENPNVCVEVVDVDRDYDDYKELREYAENLYKDCSYKEMPATMAHFGDEDELDELLVE